MSRPARQMRAAQAQYESAAPDDSLAWSRACEEAEVSIAENDDGDLMGRMLRVMLAVQESGLDRHLAAAELNLAYSPTIALRDLLRLAKDVESQRDDEAKKSMAAMS